MFLKKLDELKSKCGSNDEYEIMHEDVWINDDGSFRLKMDAALSEYIHQMAKDNQDYEKSKKSALSKIQDAKNSRGVKRCDVIDYSENGMHHIGMDIEILSLNGLMDFLKAQSTTVDDPMGGFSNFNLKFTKLGNGNIRFSQMFGSLSGKKSVEKLNSRDNPWAKIGESLGAAILADHYITVRLHAPKIVSANGKIDESKKTVESKISLAECAKENFSMEFESEIQSPGNPLVWILGGLIGIFLICSIPIINAVMRRKEIPD